MRGKFGLPSGGKPGTANTKKEEEKAVADKQSPWLKIAMSSTLSSGVNSFSNIHNVMDGVHMNFGGITKKMSNISVHGLGDNDKRSKLMAEEKKREIDQIMAILEDVRLQCPQTHFGIILAYSGSTLAPIIDVGIRFKWFRMSSEGHFDELEESHKAWYPPTADDIGCMICAQCEDSYGQGLSRYVECGPIKADSLLTTCLESALENGTFEMSGTSVSLGLKVSNKKKGRPSPTQEHEDEPNRKSESGGDFLRLSMHGDPLAHENTVLLSDASTQFLQLNGKSSIGVDEEGVFISIPTHKPVVKDATGKDSFTGKLQTSQRGLRIPSSVDLRVECVQPLSVVLTVPLMQQVVEESPQQVDNEVKTDPNGTEGDSHGEDEKMKKFLNSSILAIPWAYVGWHSPEAYATVENEAKLSEAQKAQLVQQAEEDALNFANTVCSLAEFISSLPEGTKELRICFSCDDRLERDALAMSIRALCCRPSGSTKLQRQAAFPWYQRAAMENAENETHSLIADSNETEIEMKRRVRTLQEENNSLRREKNELTSQLLEQREEMISLRAITVVNSNGIDLSSLDKSQDNDPAEAHKEGEDLSVDKYKEILGTVIELENKLQIQQKKEVENNKVRDEIEAKNLELLADKERLEKLVDGNSSRLTTLEMLYDKQVISIQKMEEDQQLLRTEIEEKDQQLREMALLSDSLRLKEQEVESLKNQLQETNNAISELKDKQYVLLDDINSLRNSRDKVQEDFNMKLALFEGNLAQLNVERSQQESKINSMQEVIQQQLKDIENAKQLEIKLKESESEIDRLNGEMNHLAKRSESQTRDLKKNLKEGAMALAEYEKALVRKTEECDDLTTQLMNATEELRALRQDSTKAKMLQMTGKISRSFSSMKRDSLSSLSSHGMSLFRNSSHGDLQENSHVKDTDEGVQKQSD